MIFFEQIDDMTTRDMKIKIFKTLYPAIKDGIDHKLIEKVSQLKGDEFINALYKLVFDEEQEEAQLYSLWIKGQPSTVSNYYSKPCPYCEEKHGGKSCQFTDEESNLADYMQKSENKFAL